MAHIRIRPNGRIQFDIHLYGQRFREGTKLMATPQNIAKAKAQLKIICAQINLNTFTYREHFPNSKKVAIVEQLQRDKYPDHQYPFFDSFSEQWFLRQKAKWKNSYQRAVHINLDKYLLPHFGNTLVSEITLAQVDYFRQSLIEKTKPNGLRLLSNRRINNLLWPLVAIISLAADECKFDYPFRRYRALKEERAESSPMTIDAVHLFLETVTPQWRDYFLIRFWTGLRSCEIHGLQWQHIDFDHRLIRIRQNWVNGETCDVKTVKSRRDLRMCDTLFEAFKRIQSEQIQTHALSDALSDALTDELTDAQFVFVGRSGQPLDTHFVSKRLWYPTLLKAGLKRRRPYETRHTAAVLHIAAHENPIYVSQMLGHSDSRLLFEVYAPYVANAARNDGRAFDELMKSKGLT